MERIYIFFNEVWNIIERTYFWKKRGIEND